MANALRNASSARTALFAGLTVLARDGTVYRRRDPTLSTSPGPGPHRHPELKKARAYTRRNRVVEQ